MKKNGDLNENLLRGWMSNHPGQSPVDEARRAICKRKVIMILAILMTVTAVTAVVLCVVSESLLSVPCIIASIFAIKVVFRASNTKATDADDFVDKHDEVLAWLGKQSKSTMRDMQNDATQLLIGQCRIIIGHENNLRSAKAEEAKIRLTDQIKEEKLRLNHLYDLFKMFGLVRPGGIGQFFPVRIAPIKKQAPVTESVQTKNKPEPTPRSELVIQS